MKWSRAVHHLEELAHACADMAQRPDEMQSRLEAELAVSLRALEPATAAYEQRRFSPGRLEPVADTVWRATQGYLDVLEATR